MATMKITPDSGLVTQGAIEFRIKCLQSELLTNSTDKVTLLARIKSLKSRLPKDLSVLTVAPKVNPALLASKADIDEYSNKVSLYS